MSRTQRRGSSALLGLLIFIGLLAGFAGAGWYVWKYVLSAGPNGVQTNTSVETTTKIYSNEEAMSVVQTAYTTATSGARQNGAQARVDSIKDNLSPELYATLSEGIKRGVAYDQISCAQTIPTKSVAAFKSSIDNKTTINVTENFGQTVKVVPVVISLYTLKIESITCPTPK